MGQRQKLYEAEEEVLGFGGFFTTTDAAVGYLEQIMRTKMWRKLCSVRHVKLKYPSYGMSGANKLDEKTGEITIHAARLCESTLIHEMTHFIAWYPGKNPEKDHGPKFAGYLLLMVKKFLGAGLSEQLRRRFDEKGVKYAEV